MPCDPRPDPAPLIFRHLTVSHVPSLTHRRRLQPVTGLAISVETQTAPRCSPHVLRGRQINLTHLGRRRFHAHIVRHNAGQRRQLRFRRQRFNTDKFTHTLPVQFLLRFVIAFLRFRFPLAHQRHRIIGRSHQRILATLQTQRAIHHHVLNLPTINSVIIEPLHEIASSDLTRQRTFTTRLNPFLNADSNHLRNSVSLRLMTAHDLTIIFDCRPTSATDHSLLDVIRHRSTPSASATK